MKTYDTYVFDLDGTLTDTMDVWMGIIRDCLADIGAPLFDDATLVEHSHDWSTFAEVGLTEEQIADFRKRAHICANERLPKAYLHEGAQEMLDTLKNSGKKLAVFSAMETPIFWPAVKTYNFDKLFDALVAGDDVPRRKPHPDGILKALNDMGIEPKDYDKVVYIGDKDTDIQAARSAGVDGVLYYPVAHQLLYDLDELKAHKPTAVITDWRELTESLA